MLGLVRRLVENVVVETRAAKLTRRDVEQRHPDRVGAGVNRGDRGAGVGRDAAGDDRGVNVLGLQPPYQVADVA